MTEPTRPHRDPVPSASVEGRKGIFQRIVEAAVKEPLLVAFLTLAVIVVGIISLKRLPVDAYPDVSAPRVSLTTQWPGHGALSYGAAHGD